MKYLIALPLLAMTAAPAAACITTHSGKGLKTSHPRVQIVDRGANVAMDRWAGGYWIQRRIEGQQASIFEFSLNTDDAKSGINAIQLAMHFAQPLTDWSQNKTTTLRPYKSNGGAFAQHNFGQFGCGAIVKGGLKIKPNLFAVKLTNARSAEPAIDKLWYLDSTQSTATLTRVDDPSKDGNMTINAEFNLVLVKALNSNHIDGSRINEAGEKREITIALDRYKFGKSRY